MKMTMLITSTLVAILCFAAMTTAAFVRKDKDRNQTKDGLVLTDLWKRYTAANKADRPKEMLAVLDTIVSKAKAERLNYDFYIAASQKVLVVCNRDWKQRDEYSAWLDKEVEEYAEPIVTFHHNLSKVSPASLTDFAVVNKARLQAARNGAFYGDGLDDLWMGMVKDDYEYTLWILAAIKRSERAMSLLNEYVGDTYPKAAYLEYRRMADKDYKYNDKGRADKMAAARSFAEKYAGSAMSLYGKAIVLRGQFDSLSRISESSAALRQAQGHVVSVAEPVEASYKNLYRDCKSAEKERLSYSKGIDKEIAGKVNDFKLLMESLDRREIGISFEKGVAVLVLRNLTKVDVEFVPDTKNAKPLVRKTINNQKKSFYVQDTVKVGLPECDDGDYIFTARNGKVTSKAKWTKKTLSVAVRGDSEKMRFFVADYLTGEPVEKVDLELLRSGKTVVRAKDVVLCKDGFTPLPDVIVDSLKDGASSYLVASFRDQNGFSRKTEEHYIYGNQGYVSDSNGNSGTFCEVFADKSAYNPGEKVEFKAVLYKGDRSRSLHTAEAGAKVKAELVNAEGNVVGSKNLTTNEYGSVAGSFDIPSGCRNGHFYVRITGDGVNSSKEIVVDEFILPTYDLAFDKVDRLFIAGDTVEVNGKVSSFSGHSLSSASVSYSVDGRGNNFASGKLSLEADGSFTIRFATDDDDSPDFFGVTVKVTDATGETKEFTKMLSVVKYLNLLADVANAAKGEISPSDGEWRGTPCMVSGGKAVVSFKAQDLMGNEIDTPIEIEYSLTGISGKKVASGKTFSGKEEAFALPKAGMYLLDAEAEIVREDGRKVSSRRRLMILRVDDSATSLDAKVKNIFKFVGACSDGTLRTGEDIKVQFGVGEGPVWAVVELFGDKRQLLDHKIIHLDGEVGKDGSLTEIVYNYKEEYPDAIRLMVFYFRDGTRCLFDHEFRRERETLELPLAFSSFTDKALPGAEYSLTLKSIPGVEAVATVFDKSSEVISANDWPVVRLTDFGADDVFLSFSVGGVHGRMTYDDVFVGSSPRNAGVRGLGRNISGAESRIDSGDGMLCEDAVVSYKMSKSASDDEVEVPDVTVRSDFSTTLAFEPFLRSDADGNIFMKFRTSDKLSTFVVQVWAHTQEMLNACVRKEMVVTVPVKVSVAEPEYLYKGDRFVLHATVSNGSDREVSGVAALQTYSSKDYEGETPFASLSKKVTVPAGGSVEVAFDVKPKDHDELGLKVVFADNAKTFSDGVFVSLPVYEAKQTLTESHSAVLIAGADKASLIKRLESEFKGTTSKGAEIREVDIRQMVLDAIPSKVEPKGKDVLSLTEALYVRKVATSLGTEVKAEKSDETIVEKIKACQNADGGFGWFEGFRSSPTLTAVVLERFAKMRDAGLDSGGFDLTGAAKWLDRNQFLHRGVMPRWYDWLSMEQYAYIRSLYSSVPFDVSPQTMNDKSEYSKNYNEFKKSLKAYLLPSASDGRGLDGQILAKARRIKTLANLVNNDGGLALASAWGIKLSAESKMKQSVAADVQSLLEYAVQHPDGGWYYPNAVMPFRGLLESEAYAHSLLCDLLSGEYVDYAAIRKAQDLAISDTEPVEVTSSTEDVTARQIAEGIRLWLMLQKETQRWDEDPAFVDALSSIMSGSRDILATKVVTLTKTYSKPFSRIAASGNGFTIERHFFKEVAGEDGKKNRIEMFPGTKLRVGDKITVEYQIWNQENRSFVKLTAPREAAFRPSDQLSGAYGWRLRPLAEGGVWPVTPQGYRNVKADRTEYYFDVYPEERTTVSENFFITQDGTFTAPVVSIEGLYAPHYRANASFGGVVATSER